MDEFTKLLNEIITSDETKQVIDALLGQSLSSKEDNDGD